MIIKDGDCEHCEHFVKDAYGQWVCEFDGECENMVREQTNEEWLHSLNTEQLAKWIAEEKLCRCYFIFPSMDEAIQDAMEWLKQPHTVKE